MKLLLIFAFLSLNLTLFGQINYVNQIIDRSDSLYGFTGTKNLIKTSDNKFLFATSQHGISSFKITPTGLLFLESKLDDTDLAYSINGIDATAISNNNKFLFVASNSSTSIYQITIFKIDSLTGKLYFRGNIPDDDNVGIRGITAMCFSNDGKYLYTSSSNDDSITCFEFNDSTETLIPIQSIVRYNANRTKFYKILISKDDRFAYTIDTENKGISIFNRDTNSGKLTYLKPVIINSELPNFGKFKGIEISNDGKNYYAYTYDRLIVLNQDSTEGDLTISQIIDNTLPNKVSLEISSLEVSENQKHVYTTSLRDSSLYVYKRDSLSGHLTFKDSIKVLKPLITSSYANNIVSIGDLIYLSSYWEHSIHQLYLDTNNNQVFFSKSYISDVQSKIKGLFNTTNITISPDQKFIYAGTETDGISIFKQEKGKDSLIFFQHINKTDINIDQKWGANQIIASDNQKWVFSISNNTNSISIFQRLANDSLKTINTIFNDNENGLLWPTSIIYSNKTSELYIGSSRSVAIFNFDTINQTINFKSLHKTNSSNGGFLDMQLFENEELIIGHNLYSEIFLLKKDSISGDFQSIDLSFLKENNPLLYGDITSTFLTPDEKNFLAVYNGSNTLVNFSFLVKKDSLIEFQRINFNELTINNKTINDVNYLKVDNEGIMLYLFSKTEPKVAILQRDLNTKEIHLVKIIEENEVTNGLDHVVGATFNQRERKVYLVSKPERSISVFRKELFIGLDQNYCSQDSIIIHSEASDSLYFWSNGSNENSIKVNQSGIYTLRTIAFNGNILYDTISITINPLPTINLGNDTSICFNDSLLLTVSPEFPTVLWNNAIGSSSIYAFNSGNYFVTVIDTNFCRNSDTLILNKFDEPTITFENVNEFCTNDSLIISIKEKYPLYVWNDTIYSDSLIIYERGQVYLEIEDINTCKKRDTLQIIKRELPYVYLPKDTLIQKNDSLKIYPIGFEIINTKWLDNIDKDTLIITPSMFTTNPFQIWVRVENSYGCFNYDTITVSVDSLAIGIHDLYSLNDKIFIHPNPVLEKIYIKNINDTPIDGILFLINDLGHLVLSQTINSKINQIDCSKLSEGTYSIIIETKEGLRLTKKIIKL